MNELEVFTAALELTDSAARSRFLDEACGGSPEIRSRIEALLRNARDASRYLESPPRGKQATISQPTERLGTLIGPYKLLQLIGEGGMGVVYMAEQAEPVKRRVALKIIKPGMDTQQVIARFEAERQALAMMDHVNIARVLDAGTTERDQPYFVMELVHGVPITRYCDDNRLTPRQRLELFVPVCQAIQHAHQKGIIHRDIKPSNVMITLYDGKPVPKVIDFGVAKATEQKLTERTLFTQYGTMVGTLEYMSPEQAEMSALGVDTRSDIYSLGVLLYELLTGSTPLSSQRIKEAAYAEILRLIKDEEPQRPSTRLSHSGEALASISAQRQMEPAKLAKLIRGELDWIVMKTLEKDRNRRYETANAFAADVQRYLDDEPVQACPPSVGYRLSKFARRNKSALAMAGLVLFFLIMLGSGAGWAVRDRAAREEELARERQTRELAMEAEVGSAIKEAERLQIQEKWREALSAAKRAHGLLAGSGSGSDELRGRVHQLRSDLEMVLHLEEIRFPEADAKTNQSESAQADTRYAAAFADYGIDVQALALTEAAERIRARTIRLELAAALDDWARVQKESRKAGDTSWKQLLTVARSVDPDEWRNQVRDALEKSNIQSLRELAFSSKINTLPVQTLSFLANVLEGSGGIKGAGDPSQTVLRQAQKKHPGDFWINYQLAWALEHRSENQQLDEAIRFYTAALALRPQNVSVHLRLGRIFAAKGSREEAVRFHKAAIALMPNNSFPYSSFGHSLLLLGNMEEAIGPYTKAIELNPKSTDAYNGLGYALSMQGKVAEGIACYRKAIELDPKNAPGHNGVAWFLATRADAEFRDSAQAVVLAKKAVKLDPTNPEHLNTLGAAHYRAGDWKAALAALEKSVQVGKGGDCLDWFFLAMAHWQLGEQEKARKWYDQAVEWMDKDKPDDAALRHFDEALRRFRAEAKELLKIEDQPIPK